MLRLSDWPEIKEIPLSGDLETDVVALLAANGKTVTAAHTPAVARKSEALARRFGLDQARASRAALVHDVSGVLKPREMLDYALLRGWDLDGAERRFPVLLHQRVSADFARDLFGVDDALILSAVACHTTLKANPSDYDMLLFLADKLAWDRAGTPPFEAVVTRALERSLARASLVYVDYALGNGMLLQPHRRLLEARKWLSENCRRSGDIT